MPITLRIPQLRNRVAWLDESPTADALRIFTERDYQAQLCVSSDLDRDDYIASLAAVILTQDAQKPYAIRRDLERYASRLLDFDCMVIVRPPDSIMSDSQGEFFDGVIAEALRGRLPANGLSVAGAKFPQDYSLPYVRYFGREVPLTYIANFVQSYDYRSVVNLSLNIELSTLRERSSAADSVPKTSTYDPSMEPLIRRAFSDCSRVVLTPQGQGRSHASVFCVHAQIAPGTVTLGRTMQPFFVKVQDRKNTELEYATYEEEVHRYVPFYLRPRLDTIRCCLGGTQGILVSDFITESESLLTCASKGRSTSALACLFDKTLLGWQEQATRDNRSLADQENFLATCPTEIHADTKLLAEKLGAKLAISDMLRLLRRCDSAPVLVGPVQGDLHANNVLVRGLDAILIDFGSHVRAPLLLDAAKLEASLLVEMDFEGELGAAEWLNMVRPLYEGDLLGCTTPKVAAESWAYKLYASIRQIRGYARGWQCAVNQYAAALSIALLEKAAKTRCIQEPELSRRAGAYVLAELVLKAAVEAHAQSHDYSI